MANSFKLKSVLAVAEKLRCEVEWQPNTSAVYRVAHVLFQGVRNTHGVRVLSYGDGSAVLTHCFAFAGPNRPPVGPSVKGAHRFGPKAGLAASFEDAVGPQFFNRGDDSWVRLDFGYSRLLGCWECGVEVVGMTGRSAPTFVVRRAADVAFLLEAVHSRMPTGILLDWLSDNYRAEVPQ